jgi:hypothetical protein
MKLGMYLIAPEPISTAYFINPSHWLCVVCIPLPLLSNDWVNTLPRQQRNFGSVVYYAVRVVSMESMRLILPRTSCYFTLSTARER